MATFAWRAAAGLPPNGGFESGDFSHWTVTIPQGHSEFSGLQPAGTAEVDVSWGPRGSLAGAISAPGGGFFAALGSDDIAFFKDNTATYDITACQSVFMNPGDTLSGEALFYNGDSEPQDTASVRVMDDHGDLVATPWSDTSGGISPGGVPYQDASDWFLWQWQAASAGQYSIVIGMTTRGDDNLASFGLFDKVSLNLVPEPSATVLIGGGLGILVVIRHKFKR